jgi:hypothetical protein
MLRMLSVLAIFSVTATLQAVPARGMPGPTDSLPSVAPAAAAPLSGVVVETMDAAGYTYLLLDTGSTRVWVAANRTPVQAGQAIEVSGVLPMENFHSKTLDRTFDKIFFASSIGTGGSQVGAGALPAGHPDVPGYAPAVDASAFELPDGHPEVPGLDRGDTPAGAGLPAGHPVVSPGGDAGGNEPVVAMERVAGGKTVAEVYAGKTELAGKSVAVRGKVTKVNNGILGRNWIHVKDGSGGPGTNDLTVTSETHTAKVGDTVVARGVLGLSRDFGGGYFYEILLEEAVLTVE